MKALILFLVLIPLSASAQDCGNDYLCFYQKQARELESYRYQQLEFQEQQLNEMRRQNDLLEQELQSMNDRQRTLENDYRELLHELRDKETRTEAQEEETEEDQFRLEEIP